MFAPDSARLTTEAAGPRTAPAHDPWLATVGSTPLVPLRSIAGADGYELWAKVESRNPTGSVKDRAALAIVGDALARGELGAGRTLVDATSGNSGVAYAMLGARLGFPVLLFVPANANPERLRALRAFGAEVVLTDPAEGTDGAQEVARRRAGADPRRYYYADQYRNPANPGAHYAGTGPEVWRQSSGRLTHFVAGVGTGGTISGAGRFLKERNPAIRVVGVEPTGPLHGLEGLKHLPTAVVPRTYDPTVVDETVRVDTEEAIAMVERLGAHEGLRAGRSAGAAVVAAVRRGRQHPGSFVVAVLADAGEPSGGSR